MKSHSMIGEKLEYRKAKQTMLAIYRFIREYVPRLTPRPEGWMMKSPEELKQYAETPEAVERRAHLLREAIRKNQDLTIYMMRSSSAFSSPAGGGLLNLQTFQSPASRSPEQPEETSARSEDYLGLDSVHSLPGPKVFRLPVQAREEELRGTPLPGRGARPYQPRPTEKVQAEATGSRSSTPAATPPASPPQVKPSQKLESPAPLQAYYGWYDVDANLDQNFENLWNRAPAGQLERAPLSKEIGEELHELFVRLIGPLKPKDPMAEVQSAVYTVTRAFRDMVTEAASAAARGEPTPARFSGPPADTAYGSRGQKTHAPDYVTDKSIKGGTLDDHYTYRPHSLEQAKMVSLAIRHFETATDTLSPFLGGREDSAEAAQFVLGVHFSLSQGLRAAGKVVPIIPGYSLLDIIGDDVVCTAIIKRLGPTAKAWFNTSLPQRLP